MDRTLAVAIAAVSITCALGAAADTAPRSDAVPAVPTAADLVRAWQARAFGFDSLEAYEVVYDAGRTEFAIARRWVEDGPQILVDLQSPPSVSRFAMLFLPLKDGRSATFVFTPTPSLHDSSKAGEVRRGGFSWLGLPLPQRRGSRHPPPRIPAGTLSPLPLEAMDHERLPDEVLANEECWVVESRLRDDRRQRRVQLAFSKASGILLRSRHFETGAATVEVRIAPEHVETHEDRLLPVRREILSTQGGWKATLIRRNLLLDPALPARVFTTRNLEIQHFPRF